MIRKSDFNPECITLSQMKLIFNARMYYRRLTAWARAYILSRFLGVGTADELFARLYLEALNQADLLKMVFGREDAYRYSRLLGNFAILLRDIISAQIDRDDEAMARYVDRFSRNVEERAAFLHTLNPYWSEEEYKSLLNTYIQYLLDLANLVATGDYDKDIEVYDNLSEQSDKLGDVFAEGIYNFLISGSDDAKEAEPEDDGQCIPYDLLDVVFGTKMFWFELIIWTRNYMLSRFIGFGASERVFNHLSHVADDFLDLVGQIFGSETAEEYARSFNTYIELFDAFVTAQMEGDSDKINEIIPLLYDNAYERARIITAGNPYWNYELWRAMIQNALRSTIEQSISFLIGDYSRSLDIFGSLLDLAEYMGNEFERGFLRYMNSIQNNVPSPF